MLTPILPASVAVETFRGRGLGLNKSLSPSICFFSLMMWTNNWSISSLLFILLNECGATNSPLPCPKTIKVFKTKYISCHLVFVILYQKIFTMSMRNYLPLEIFLVLCVDGDRSFVYAKCGDNSFGEEICASAVFSPSCSSCSSMVGNMLDILWDGLVL